MNLIRIQIGIQEFLGNSFSDVIFLTRVINGDDLLQKFEEAYEYIKQQIKEHVEKEHEKEAIS